MPNCAEPRYRFVRPRWHAVFAVIDAVGAFIVGFLRRCGIKPSPPQAAADVHRILLLQFDHLGDAVLTTSILPALARHYAQAKIDVLCSPWNADVFASRPEVHRLWISKWNRFRRGFSWLWPWDLLAWSLQLRR